MKPSADAQQIRKFPEDLQGSADMLEGLVKQDEVNAARCHEWTDIIEIKIDNVRLDAHRTQKIDGWTRQLEPHELQFRMAFPQEGKRLSRPARRIDHGSRITRKVPFACLGNAGKGRRTLGLEGGDLRGVVSVGCLIVILGIAEDGMAESAHVEDENLLRYLQQRQVVEIEVVKWGAGRVEVGRRTEVRLG